MRAVDGAWNTQRACFSQHCARRCHHHLVCAYPWTLRSPHVESRAAQFVHVSNQNSDICCFPTFLGARIEELVLEYAEATESERKNGREKMVECLHLSLKLRSFTLCRFHAPDLSQARALFAKLQSSPRLQNIFLTSAPLRERRGGKAALCLHQNCPPRLDDGKYSWSWSATNPPQDLLKWYECAHTHGRLGCDPAIELDIAVLRLVCCRTSLENRTIMIDAGESHTQGLSSPTRSNAIPSEMAR
jgi:hypothetical protein